MFIHVWFTVLSRALHWHYRQASINTSFYGTKSETSYKPIITAVQNKEEKKKILYFIKGENVFSIPQG